jgi:hypothetical protein
MPYPNYGNQSMAVNVLEDWKKHEQNSFYMNVCYKGFPYIFLVAQQDIRKGEQLQTIMPKDNEAYQGVCVCMCVYVCVYARMCGCMCACVCVCMYVCVCVYACMCVCMYVCVYVCMYICIDSYGMT